MSTRQVAVIGAGVSGLTAAYVLRNDAQVTLFEAQPRLGGHAHTHQCTDAAGTHGVDSGFIVHNDRTYPQLQRLFAELDVAVHPTEMSMSIHCEECDLVYAGGRGAGGLFAQPRRLASPRHWRMLLEVTRFQRAARDHLESGDPAITYGEFLAQHDFGEHFIAHYAVPVVACVWSTGLAVALDYPARYLFAFLAHHGFLTVKNSPTWFTVEGGSARYVEAVADRLDDVRRGSAVSGVSRDADGVHVTTAAGTERFDSVVVATHPDEALALLHDASPVEKEVLGAFDYAPNRTVLHSDDTMLPGPPRGRASWNYRMSACAAREGAPVVTYWMNRLQGLETDRSYLVTLNAEERIAPDSVIATMDYAHPVYAPHSVAAQERLGALNTAQTVFAGAYHGWGFHEDGCASGVAAARALGVEW